MKAIKNFNLNFSKEIYKNSFFKFHKNLKKFSMDSGGEMTRGEMMCSPFFSLSPMLRSVFSKKTC